MIHGDLRSFHQSSVSRIVKRVSNAFARHLQTYVNFPNHLNERRRITEKFYQKANFPRVIGCIDCTHVRIISPGGENAEVFRNRKGWMSINVQVRVIISYVFHLS